jgi:hypothetical protein
MDPLPYFFELLDYIPFYLVLDKCAETIDNKFP